METITVEVAYGNAHTQKLYTVNLIAGSTARQAALAAPVCRDFADADPQHAPLGIFGKRVPDERILRHGERVEIYRPLIADAKAARRKRAAQSNQAA